MVTETPSPTRSDVLLRALEDKLAPKVSAALSEKKRILAGYGDRTVTDVTVAQAYGGMRGVKCMVTETSSVDPLEGIRFRGYPIPELRKRLPHAVDGEEPLPEGIFHLLLTGELPTPAEVGDVTRMWREHEELPGHVRDTLDRLPRETHPMTQFSLGILAMQTDSVFARRYREGLRKEEYWRVTLEDAMGLLAKLPLLAAYIYRRTYRNGEHVPPADSSLDWAGNLAHMLGVEQPEFRDLMRLYLSIHADHEGGNVSAHTTHLVGSALSDPYLCLSAGMNGLAGPLHGLASQEVVRWIMTLKDRLGSRPTPEAVAEYCEETLSSGQVIPGYGHAVLRRTDPRYTAQREFALRHMPDDENVEIVRMLYDIVPATLEKHGKAKNPWPNVDAHSGVLLIHYGIVEYDFYTVLFGVSRAMGVLASLVWDRAELLPLERPKSVTTDWIKQQIAEGRFGAPAGKETGR